ncbi:hypothetical protein ABPG72_014821 [Tetrahymena utriculariae]
MSNIQDSGQPNNNQQQRPLTEQDLVQDALRLIRFFAKNKGTQLYNENKAYLLQELVNKVKKLSEMRSPKLKSFYNEEGSIINVIRQFMIETRPLLRQNTIKFFRLIFESEKFALQYIQYNIPIFIARTLEREIKPDPRNQSNQQSQHQEIDQALKFIKRWIEIAPKTFPKLLANSLVAFAESTDEQYKSASIEIVRKLAMGNPQQCAWSGGIKLLIDCIIDPNLESQSDAIVQSLLFLLNDPEYRNLIRVYLDFPKIFGVFTDIDCPPKTKPKQQSDEEYKKEIEGFDRQLQLAKKALITILKTWKGLIYLGNQRIAMKSLVQALRQPIHEKIRNAIYDILGELLALGGKECLGKTLTVQHFLNYYLMILIQLLLDCDLFSVLVELSGLEDEKKSLRAQEQLKQLTTLMFNLLPNCSKYTDFLISAANQCNEQLTDLKAWSSNIVSIMGNYVFDSNKKNKKTVHSKFMYQCENFYLSTQLGLPSHRINKQTIGKIKFQNETESDDLNFDKLLSDTNIQKDSKQWNWNSILEIVQTYFQSKFGDLKNRFLKKLLPYFHPHQKQFISLEWKESNFVQAKVGYLLIQNLLKIGQEGAYILTTPPSELICISRSFMGELYHILVSDYSNDMKHEATQLLKPSEFNEKMIREYISWIGLFSQMKQGQKLLEEAKIWDTLKNYVTIDKGKRDHILNLILYCLDYGKENNSREFLQFCLEKGSINLQKSCLELLRLLNRSEFIDFSKWGIELIVQKLDLNQNEDIRMKALSVAKEVTQEKQYLMEFLKKQPCLQDLGKEGDQFLITLLSSDLGFEYLSKMSEQQNWVEEQMQRWKEQQNLDYVNKIETCLLKALNYVQDYDEQNVYRFPDILNNPQNSFLTLGFIHRMPWIMTIDFNTADYKDTVQFMVQIEYQGQQNVNQFILVGTPDPYSAYLHPEKYKIPIDYKFQINFSLQVGKNYLDKQCNDQAEPYVTHIKFDFNDKSQFPQFQNKQVIINKGGINLIFDQDENHNTIKLRQIRLFMKMGENNRSNQEKIPLHFYGELVKTKQGQKMLLENKIIENCFESIKNPKECIMNKRASLWAIGNICYCKEGIKRVKDMKLIDHLVPLAEQSETLSLRGTCLYILNMIANTEQGRIELEKQEWISHWNSNLGWITMPNNMRQFFYIRNIHKEGQRTYWPNQNEFWDKLTAYQKGFQMGEDENKLLENVALMSNALTFKNASSEIKKIAKKNPTIFEDKNVFFNVILMLDFYKFKHDNRKFILSFFDRLFSSEEIFLKLDTNPILIKPIV